MNDLRTAAQQALEALEDVDGPITALLGGLLGSPDADAPGAKVRTAITALRDALAQQKDPTDPGNDVDVLREHVRHLERRVRQLQAHQAEPIDTDCHAQGICQRSGYGIGQQAEPVEPVAWECKAGGLKPLTQRQYDAQTAATKRHYTRIAPPQRQPLTDATLWGMWVDSPSDVLRFARAVERAHGIKE